MPENYFWKCFLSSLTSPCSECLQTVQNVTVSRRVLFSESRRVTRGQIRRVQWMVYYWWGVRKRMLITQNPLVWLKVWCLVRNELPRTSQSLKAECMADCFRRKKFLMYNFCDIKNVDQHASFEAFTAVTIQIEVFRVVRPFNVVFHRFRGPCCHLEDGGSLNFWNVGYYHNTTQSQNPEYLDLSWSTWFLTSDFHILF